MAEGKTEKKKNTSKKNKTPSPELKIKPETKETTPVNKLENEKTAIYERLEPLREQAVILTGIRKERDVLNDKVKKLSEEVRAIKVKRDELNKKVQDEKKKRDSINTAASSLRKDFKKSFGDHPGRRGSSDLQALRKQVKSMRWDIETKGFNFAEEKKRSKALSELEKKLKTLEKFDNARLGVLKQDKDARSFHSNVIELSKQSEEVHQSLVVLYEKLKEAREKADAKHNKVVEELDKLKKIESEREDDLNRLNELRGEIRDTRDEWEEQKVEESKKSAKERGAEAFAEFEKGGRVDFRDLQLKFLGEEGKKAKKK
jgi:uncharacterized coiled-coil DUF342 family protein|tara:strand:+ start:40873 stop:41820 length:948 start_codon:yes stop_codon:yes gene_type:complete